MSYRYGLVVAALILTGGSAAADTIDIQTAVRESEKQGCRVGEVQPVLAIQIPAFFYHPWFEGVAVARSGSVYTSEQCTGNVYRIRPSGRRSVIATIPYGIENDPGCNNAGTLGLGISDDGDVWVVVLSWLPESHGVWRIKRDGTAELAVPLPPNEAVIPNAITFDPNGNLYVTESVAGAIWKAPPGGQATLWLQSDILAPPAGGFFGANGIGYKHGALYVVNTDKGGIVKVPLNRDGSPGEPVGIATGLNGPDGLTFDAFGNLYVVTAYGAQLVRIGAQGTPEVVLDLGAAGVAYPTSLDFGKTVREMNTVYITNFIPLPGQPNLVEVNLCEHDRSLR
jgi:sugar lactone lactonase YvrE